MNDKKLVDLLVKLDILEWLLDDNGDDKFLSLHGSGRCILLNDDYDMQCFVAVRDWRVAGALMEKMDGELLIWRQAYDNDSPVWIVETHLTNADGRDESLPRAIIEACCDALEDKECTCDPSSILVSQECPRHGGQG